MMKLIQHGLRYELQSGSKTGFILNEPQSLRDCMPTSKFYANFGCLFIETKNKNRVTEQ